MSYPINKDLYHNYFSKIDTQEKAYWLGFILGDGYISFKTNSMEIALNIKDEAHLDKFAKAINWKLKKYYNASNNTVRLSWNSREMKEDLIKLGVTPRKSFTAKIPKIAKELKIHLIRGLFDADGSIHTHSRSTIKEYPSFSIVGSFDCLQDVKDFLNIKSSIIKDHSIWCIKQNGTPSVKKIYTRLYKNSIIHLDRKKEKFETYYPKLSI